MSINRLVTLFLSLFLLLANCTQKNEQSNPIVTDQEDPNAQAKLIVNKVLDSLYTITVEEDALALIKSYPQNIQDKIFDELSYNCHSHPEQNPQSEHPAAKLIMASKGIAQEDIVAVQMMVWNPESQFPDTLYAVITGSKWYYVNTACDRIRENAPETVGLTTEVDIYGYYVDNVGSWWWCQSSEWVVDFLMPVCFHEISPGQFDGIIDAWAPNPPCDQYNGGWCAFYLCGIAWDGAGYLGWWDFQDCSSTWSRKVGKLVQKRWIYAWRNAGRSDTQIANSVRARIRY